MDLVTTSSKAAFQLCGRLYLNKYVLGYRPLASDDRLEFGTVFHAALDGWWTAYKNGNARGALESAYAPISAAKGVLDEGMVAKAYVLMDGYDARWAPAMEDLEVLEVELEFRGPLRSPGGRASRRERIAGKIDKLVRRRSDRTLWLVEHKTSGADLSSGSSYWQKLRMDAQVSMYFDGAVTKGYTVAGCIYDVIAKPEMRPLKATPLEKRKFTKDGRLYANQRAQDESIDEFRQRLSVVVSEAPEEHFQRAEVVRLDTELEAARADVYQTAQLVRKAKSAQLWPRNPNACHTYGRPCAFIDVCSGVASLDDDTRFQKLQNLHPELSADT